MIEYLPKPHNFIFQWHITERCNWNCRHCYQADEYLKDELDTEELFHILDQFVSMLKLWGIRGRINVTGGEPFIRDDFFRLLEKFHSHRDLIDFGIMTNGSFITADVAKRLKMLGVKGVQVSLEGMEETNDAIRGAGSFKKTVDSLKTLVKEGVYTRISFTSHKKNYKEFPEVVELGKEFGVNVVWTDRLVLCGKGKQLQEDVMGPLEVKEFYESVYRISKQLQNESSKTTVPTHRSLYFLACDDSPASHVCALAERITAIMPNGDLMACRRMPIVVGNLMKQNFFELWYGNEVLWKLRDKNEINGICKSCKEFDRCVGGSRCVAYSYFDDPFAPDPQCWVAFDKLPSTEDIEPYKSDSKEEFSPKSGHVNQSGAKPYLHQLSDSILYVSEQGQNETDYVTVTPKDLDKDIVKGNKMLLVSFDLLPEQLNTYFGKKVTTFLTKLKNDKISFKVSKPLPRCLFGFDYQKIIKEFNTPASCQDCLELFRVNDDGILLCNGEKGPKLKYMNDRKQIYEYFEFFHEKPKLDNKCNNCIWLLRKQCSGLCIT